MTPHDDQRVIVLDATMDSIARVQHELTAFWTRFPWVGEEGRMSFELALVELVGNIVRYALTPGTSARLQLGMHGRELRALLTDGGRPFLGDLDTVAMPPLEAESGRGLAVITQLVDTFTYERRGGTNQWTIGLRMTQGEASRVVDA